MMGCETCFDRPGSVRVFILIASQCSPVRWEVSCALIGCKLPAWLLIGQWDSHPRVWGCMGGACAVPGGNGIMSLTFDVSRLNLWSFDVTFIHEKFQTFINEPNWLFLNTWRGSLIGHVQYISIKAQGYGIVQPNVWFGHLDPLKSRMGRPGLTLVITADITVTNKVIVWIWILTNEKPSWSRAANQRLSANSSQSLSYWTGRHMQCFTLPNICNGCASLIWDCSDMLGYFASSHPCSLQKWSLQ